MDYTNAWLRDLTRERRLEREHAALSQTLYFGGSKSIIKFRPEPAIAKSVRRKAKKVARQVKRVLSLDLQHKYWRIYELQGRRCYICRDAFADIDCATDDHVTPKAMGGKRVGNILHACFTCNNGKSNRAPFACEILYLESINLQLPRALLRRANGKYVEIPRFTPLRARLPLAVAAE